MAWPRVSAARDRYGEAPDRLRVSATHWSSRALPKYASWSGSTADAAASVRRTAARCCDRLERCGLPQTGSAPRLDGGWSGSRSRDEDAERVAGGVRIDAQRLLGILGAVS